MNIPNPTPGKEEKKNDQGFTWVPSQKRGGRKKENQEVNKNISMTNKFDVCEDISEVTLDKHPEGN